MKIDWKSVENRRKIDTEIMKNLILGGLGDSGGGLAPKTGPRAKK